MSGDGAGMGMGFTFNTSDDPGTGKDGKKGGNAEYAPRTGGSVEYGPPPLRLVTLANFRGAPAERAPRRVTVDPLERDAAMAKLEPSLFFTVTDHLRGDSKGLEVRLAPRTLKDLDPAAVAQSLPAFDLPLKLLAELDAVASGTMTASQFGSGLGIYSEVPALAEAVRLAGAASKAGGGSAAPAPNAAAPKSAPKQESGGSTLDNIFAMVDAPAGEAAPAPAPKSDAPPRKRSAIGGLISAIGGSGGGSKTPAGMEGVRAAAQAAIDLQLSEILHHPQFREVEGAWRGLALVCKQVVKKSAVVLEVVDTAREQVAETFHEHVYPTEYGGTGETPLSMTLIDFAFDKTSADLAIIEALATDAEAIQAPVVVSLTPEVFGVAPDNLAGMDNPKAVFEAGFAEWNGKRKGDAARWTVTAYNRILLREPHVPGRRAGGYSEPVAGAGDLCWGNAGWAHAALAVASVGRTGWPADLAGARSGALSELPLWSREEEPVLGPVEALLSDHCVADLAENGVAALTARKGRDVAILLRAPMLHKAAPSEPKVNNTLGYQLLAARLGETLLGYKEQLAGGGHADVLARVEAFMKAVVGDTGPGASVQVQGMPDPEAPDRLMVGVTVRTGRPTLGGVEVHLGARV